MKDIFFLNVILCNAGVSSQKVLGEELFWLEMRYSHEILKQQKLQVGTPTHSIPLWDKKLIFLKSSHSNSKTLHKKILKKHSLNYDKFYFFLDFDTTVD